MKSSGVKFIFVFFIFSFRFSLAQTEVNIIKITDQILVKTFSSIESFSIKKTSNLYIIIYTVNNGSGSANLSDSDESTNTILLSVSQYGEEPINKLFSIGPFYNLKIDQSSVLSRNNAIIIEHGIYNKRKKSTVLISLDNILYK